jgi:hypothetical protein
MQQDEFKNDKTHIIRQYFYSKKLLYIITASSRDGETSAMKRFLASMIFKPDTADSKNLNATKFSDLKATQISLEENLEKTKQKKEKKKVDPDPKINPLSIVTQPLVLSLVAPSNNFLGGTVRLEVTFSEVGQISKIVVCEKLKPVFQRDVILSALRMKFLPEEKDDMPMSVTKTVQYNYGRY